MNSGSRIQASDFTELKNDIDAKYAANGVTPYTWQTGSVNVTTSTRVQAAAINDMRAAVRNLYTQKGVAVLANSVWSTNKASGNRIVAQDILDLRIAIDNGAVAGGPMCGNNIKEGTEECDNGPTNGDGCTSSCTCECSAWVDDATCGGGACGALMQQTRNCPIPIAQCPTAQCVACAGPCNANGVCEAGETCAACPSDNCCFSCTDTSTCGPGAGTCPGGKTCYDDAASCTAAAATDCLCNNNGTCEPPGECSGCADCYGCGDGGICPPETCDPPDGGATCDNSCQTVATYYWCTDTSTCTSGGVCPPTGETCYTDNATCVANAPTWCTGFGWKCNSPTGCTNYFSSCIPVGAPCYPTNFACSQNASTDCPCNFNGTCEPPGECLGCSDCTGCGDGGMCGAEECEPPNTPTCDATCHTIVPPADCNSAQLSNCDLVLTTSGNTSGACAGGYTGSCSYTCTNGTWGAPSSNTCACIPNLLSCTADNQCCSGFCSVPGGNICMPGGGYCGNGIKAGSEECDNDVQLPMPNSGDGCSSTCTCEYQGWTDAGCGAGTCAGVLTSMYQTNSSLDAGQCAPQTRCVPSYPSCSGGGSCAACSSYSYDIGAGCNAIFGTGCEVCDCVSGGSSCTGSGGTLQAVVACSNSGPSPYECCGGGGGASCTATQIGNCTLVGTADTGTSGTCASGFTGTCSYTCNNGTWGTPSSNTCTPQSCNCNWSDQTNCNAEAGSCCDWCCSPATTGAGCCVAAGNCPACPNCNNGAQDCGETGVDCGGTCAGCCSGCISLYPNEVGAACSGCTALVPGGNLACSQTACACTSDGSGNPCNASCTPGAGCPAGTVVTCGDSSIGAGETCDPPGSTNGCSGGQICNGSCTGCSNPIFCGLYGCQAGENQGNCCSDCGCGSGQVCTGSGCQPGVTCDDSYQSCEWNCTTLGNACAYEGPASQSCNQYYATCSPDPCPAQAVLCYCADNTQDNGETGVDCGGPCAACPCSGNVSDGTGDTQCYISPQTIPSGNTVSGGCADNQGSCTATCNNGSLNITNGCIDDWFECTGCASPACGGSWSSQNACSSACSTNGGVCLSCSGPSCPDLTAACQTCTNCTDGGVCGGGSQDGSTCYTPDVPTVGCTPLPGRVTASACASGGGSCGAGCPNCGNGTQDCGETGTDCGGPCVACPPTCTDGIQNGFESGIDCGGPNCGPCVAVCGANGCESGENQTNCCADCGCPGGEFCRNGSSCGTCATFDGFCDRGAPCNENGCNSPADCSMCWGNGCDDSDPCTADSCNVNCESCDHAPTLGTACGLECCTSGQLCQGGTTCVPDTGGCPDCGNGVQDCQELGIDCGGPDCAACTLCGNGSIDAGEDCLSCPQDVACGGGTPDCCSAQSGMPGQCGAPGCCCEPSDPQPCAVC